MCIICFLNKENQKTIRCKAQLATDRFEHTLNFYKKVYIHDFKLRKGEELCEKHLSFNKHRDILDKISLNIIENTFDIFESAYIKWINNDSVGARNAIEEFFEKNNLYSELNLKDKLMFRARCCNNRLSHWDMFHIPFNKRYLIKNQRYSLVGRPMLYLGFSPEYVLKEIGVDESQENCFLSGFYLKENCNLKLCDFRYNFPRIENTMFDKIINEEELDNDSTLKDFLLSIVASICSFPKRTSNASEFCEEYVLPQIISEIICNKKYDGLLYSSIKNSENKFENSFFDANAVIFTNYDQTKSKDVTYVYDKDLYNKFNITTAKKITDINCSSDKIVRETLLEVSSNKDNYKLPSMINNELSNILISNIDDIKLSSLIHRSIIYEILVNNIY